MHPGVLTRARCSGAGVLTRALAGLARGPYTQPANATPGVLTRDLAGLAVRKQL